MAKLLNWSAPHVKLETIEYFSGKKLISLRELMPKNSLYSISVRVEKEHWKDLGIDQVLWDLGMDKYSAVYINL